MLLLGAVFLTGATSLAYEVAWTRGLVLVLGSTALTAAVVLCVFVASLGLGARWAGPRVEAHPRPLVLYGMLEIGAAIWAVLALTVAGLLEAPYVWIASGAGDAIRVALRVVVATIVVAPGAFMLGATLPALVRHWVRDPDGAGRGTAWVYGVNTVGAVAGCLVAGFFGVEALGVPGLLLAAGFVAATVGAIAAIAGTRLAPRAIDTVAPSDLPGTTPSSRARVRDALAAALLCGFLGMGVEIVGFRILVFFLEGFTATFTAMLGIFILGLGLGSLVLGPLLARSRRPWIGLGALLGAAGVVLLLELILVVPRLEDVMDGIRDWAYRDALTPADVAAALRWSSLVGAAALFLVPAFLLGATFSLCVRWAEVAGLAPGRAVGRVYLFNSIGTLLVPIVVGFLLIPMNGVPGAWLGLAFFALAVAIAMAAVVALSARHTWAVVAAVLAVVLMVGSAPAAGLVEASHVIHGRVGRTLLAVRTDAVTTASVVETRDGERILYTDDFAAAADGRHYRYMRMLGHLPVLLAKNPENAMVIAFGTGTTAGAVAGHDEVKRIEVVEVSPAVLDLANYFAAANRHVLDDTERVEVVPDDGRNALLLHDADLDVITLEPLMPYSPQGLPFYTKEFYELARSKLRDGGVLCQWVPVHAMPAGLYAAFVRTFFEVFPDGSLWFFEQSTALIGIKGEGADRAAIDARFASMIGDFEDAGFTRADLLASAYVAGGRRVLQTPPPSSEWTSRTVTDMDPFPEFHPTPRASFADRLLYLPRTLDYLAGLVSAEDRPALDEGTDRVEALRQREGTRLALEGRYWDAAADAGAILRRSFVPGTERHATAGRQLLEARRRASEFYRRALERLPGEAVLTWRRARAERAAVTLEVLGLFSLTGGEPTTPDERRRILRLAVKKAEAAATLEDGDPLASARESAIRLHAAALARLGRCGAALEVLEHGLSEVGFDLPRGDPAGRLQLLQAAHDAVERHSRGEAAEPDPRLAGWFDGLAPCAPEGIAAVERVLGTWDRAVRGGQGRAMRLAARNLVAAAKAEGVVDELLAHVRASEVPAGVGARAARGGLLRMLDAEDATLLDSLSAQDPETRAAAAGVIAEWSPGALLRHLPALLMDPVREVRVAVAAALFDHQPEIMGEYDPDGSEEARRAIVARLDAVLRR